MSSSNPILSVGIDIGTTSISIAVLDINKLCICKTYTLPYNCDIPNTYCDLREQDPDLIYKNVQILLAEVNEEFPHISSIGVTGQMHGILYIDKKGNAVSPLINWQDKRGDRLFEDTVSYCSKIFEITGEAVPSGYGLATLFYDHHNDRVPENAYSFCSIMDYVAIKLTGSTTPVIHSSVANSFGLFDLKKCCFKTDKINMLGINIPHIPQVTDDYLITGYYGTAAVSVAIGDNQASYLGSVKDIDNSILVNIGTGSQISAVTDTLEVNNDLEIRPLVKDKYIVCGAALCGGSAYALLEKFFRSYIRSAKNDTSSQYDIINELAKDAYINKIPALTVNTLFKGKRSDTSITGSILGITDTNFTPGALALGFINGICRELYEYAEGMVNNKTTVVASGNAVQRIEIFKDVISDMFSLPVRVTSGCEEAATGTALFSALTAGYLEDIHALSKYINYN
ncbi:MAG: hypothetical protein E7578_00675 [Ruminococcaceae bacterium]|nr:hypothetical protein [Oscillospiraceae bacterium]